MFSSRTARGLLTESKTILMNYSCLALVLKSKHCGDTQMVLRGYFRFQSLSTLSMVTLNQPKILVIAIM